MENLGQGRGRGVRRNVRADLLRGGRDHQSSAGNLDLVAVALAHGLAIAIMVSIMAHISGGVFNPAIQIALWVTGKMPTAARRGAASSSQLVGAVVAAAARPQVLRADACLRRRRRRRPRRRGRVCGRQGIVIEAMLTFFLVWAVFGTAVDDQGPCEKTAGFTIGLVITIDIIVGAA